MLADFLVEFVVGWVIIGSIHRCGGALGAALGDFGGHGGGDFAVSRGKADSASAESTGWPRGGVSAFFRGTRAGGP